MDQLPDEVAFNLGRRLRDARLRRGLTLAEVAIESGISTSAVSRMELGNGAAAPLAAWVAVARTVAVRLFPSFRDDTDVYLAAVTNLMAIGGWEVGGRSSDGDWFDRPARPNPHFRHVQDPHERVVVRIVRTLTNLDVERYRLVAAVHGVAIAAPQGVAVAGLLVVPRSTNNRRRARSIHRLSTSGWILALRSSEARMPLRPGVVWLAPRGTHWLPVG
jgi:transcriptional regulator with XRE-family HTH domain